MTIKSHKKRKRRNHATSPKIKLNEGLQTLMEEYPDLHLRSDGSIDGGDEYVFISLSYHPFVPPPQDMPYLIDEENFRTHVLLPSDVELDQYLQDLIEPVFDPDDISENCISNVPDDHSWPADDEIEKVLRRVHQRSYEEHDKDEDRELLELEFEGRSDLFAGTECVPNEQPMIVDGFMSDGDISVFYGELDEFKTTVLVDMMAHVAMGVPWQGMSVSPRPIIWYALEGREEVIRRILALQHQLSDKDPPWGNRPAPFTVRDRIPESYPEWRVELIELQQRFETIYNARWSLGELPLLDYEAPKGRVPGPPIYPEPELALPIVVIDPISQWLGGEDEKGPKSVERIGHCIDLLKRWQHPQKYDAVNNSELALEKCPEQDPFWTLPPAGKIVLAHHSTKSGTDFAGHRAIGSDTQSLYRIKRKGKITDEHRSMSGSIIPVRTKNMAKPAPLPFEVQIVAVEGTQQNAPILKPITTKQTGLPSYLLPIIAALRDLEDPDEVSADHLNRCIDTVANNRTSRSRYRQKLLDIGILEALTDETDTVCAYAFHDPGELSLNEVN